MSAIYPPRRGYLPTLFFFGGGEGCFKMYGVDKKGGEHDMLFAAEND